MTSPRIGSELLGGSNMFRHLNAHPFGASFRRVRRRASRSRRGAGRTDKKSDCYRDRKALADPDEYRRVGAFIVPDEARWASIRKVAQADDIKVRLDSVLELLEKKYPDKLRGLRRQSEIVSHRDEIRAEIRSSVKRVLRSRRVREADFKPFVERFMQQAEAQYGDWPLVA